MEPSQFMRVIYGVARGDTRQKIVADAGISDKLGTYAVQKIRNKQRAFADNYELKFGGKGVEVGADYTYRTVHRVKWDAFFIL